VLPGEHNSFLASDVPLETNPAMLTGRLTGRDIETRRVTPGCVEYVFTTDRFVVILFAFQVLPKDITQQ
jgi:hypothetical protein